MRPKATKTNGDANGDLTSDGTYTYTWDARNHLTGIAKGRSAVASFVYDAFGRRMSKTINGTTTQFVYDGLNPVQELNGAIPPVATANMLTGLDIDEYFQRSSSSGTLSYLTDMLGSTVALADSSGALDTTYTYDPFGNVTVNGADTNPYQFTGRENDATGLYYYRARYYSPTLQRLISQDPASFAGGSPNLYAYVWENPISWADPDGLWGTGLIGTASAEGGLGALGAAASASAGGGAFWGGPQGINVGGFVSAGGLVGGPGLGPSYPAGNCGNFAAGAYAGISGGAFVTNANSANDLRGPFYGVNFDLGIFSVQVAWSGGTVIGSITAGPGEIAGASGYQTNTWAGTLAAQY